MYIDWRKVWLSFISSVQFICCDPGCVINQARWTDDWTALHIAAMMGAERIVDLLLAAGADPDKKTSEGFTAAKVAENSHFQRLRDKIRRADKSKIKMALQLYILNAIDIKSMLD